MIKRLSHSMLLVPLIAIAMRVVSEPTANLSYVLIAGYALRGRVQALQALALSWLFSMFSPVIAPWAAAASIGRYGILFAAVISILIHSPVKSGHKKNSSLVYPTLLLGAFFVFHSFIFSPMVDVSVLKAISWTLTMTVLLAGWSGLSVNQRKLLSHQLFTMLIGIMVVSLPLLIMPAGYLTNGTGFQGVLGQPQAFGFTMAILGAWAIVQMLAVSRPSWWQVLLVLISLVLVVMSEARTGVLALILGVFIAVSSGPILSGQSLWQMMPGLRSLRVHLLFWMLLFGIFTAWPMLVDRFETFVSKRNDAANIIEAYEMSRGALMDAMWKNINENPWQGIGFGIASVPELMVVKRDPIMGLPTSALIEKGVVPIAILEEVGIPGFLLVAVWLWTLLLRCARAGIGPLAAFLVILLLNMGEATLFSPGGVGLIALIFIAWSSTGEPVNRKRV